MSFICTQLKLENHVPVDPMHRVSQRDTIKSGRAAYRWKEAGR
jgi:hypothetical protein